MRSNRMTEEEKQERERKQAQKMIEVLNIGTVFGAVGVLIGYLMAAM